MYRKILVALENSKADGCLLPHVQELAQRLGSQLLLVHVADGWVARNYDSLRLADSDEMKADQLYLECTAESLRAHGVNTTTRLARGNPPDQILHWAQEEGCDLIAMASHGHGLVGDIVHGSTIHEVRHKTSIPVLLVRAVKQA